MSKQKRTPGLKKRGTCWHIDKIVNGQRICESTGTADLVEAERYLVRRLEQIRQASVYGVRPRRTFDAAAAKYLDDNRHKTSIMRDADCLAAVMPHIGKLALQDIHDGTVAGYIAWRRQSGAKSTTVRRDLAVVRRVLRLAAQSWRDEHGLTWLETPPLLAVPDWQDKRKPRPLSKSEEAALLAELPDHLRDMMLFKVNTGAREQEVCGLSWDWEVDLPELQTSVFIIPAHEGVKNGEDRLIVLNDIARAAVNRQRGNGSDWVFALNGQRIHRMNNTAWKSARVRAGVPDVRVHDLKHTFGMRLRAAGVSLEDRKVLLGHKNQDITTHYSAVELRSLIASANRVVDLVSGSNNVTLLRGASHAKPTQGVKAGSRRAARK